MSDLLDLRAEGATGRRRRRRLPKPVGLLVVAVVLLGLVAGVVLGGRALIGSFASVPDFTGAGTGRAVVQVKTGDSATDVGATLVQNGVVKSVKAFSSAAAADDRSRKLQPGYYALRQQMSAVAALSLLLEPSSRLRGRVTIPEGSPLATTLTLIAKDTEVPLADLRAAAKNTAALGLPAYAKGRLEGFVFPATYDVEPGSSAVEVLRMMVERFTESAVEVDLEGKSRALGLTPYQTLTVASLAEKEAGVPRDFPKVARVVYNRLKAGMALQLDSTVNYVRGQRAARLSLADISVKSPYNSYLHAGLPPTPIDSPGTAALEAALTPAAGNWIYFITIDKQGNSLFTANYNAFLAAKAKAQRDGVY